MRRLPFLAAACCALAVTIVSARSDIQYIYDELGRLVGVIDANGNAAAYHYDAVGNLLSITRTTANQVAIIEFTPDSGPIGQTVTIRGTGFSATPAQDTVTFNGTTASISSAMANTLVVTVPSGASTGSIAVSSPNGSATSDGPFTVAAVLSPSISGFTPGIGVAGDLVTISGSNFDTVLAQNRLVLNTSRATVTTAAASSLSVTVPVATASGKFRVATPVGNATSAADFFVVPTPYVPSDVDTATRLAFGTASNVAIGTANKIALAVFDGTAGQRVSVKIVPGPVGMLYLYRPAQTVLAQLSIGVLTTLLEPTTVPVTGTYQVLLAPTGAGTGTTALTVYDVPADYSGTLTLTQAGSSGTITTTVPGQNGKLTFTGSTNDRVSVVVGTGPGASLALRRPDDSTISSATVGALAAFIDTTVLPSSGTYSLFGDYTAANTGSFNVTLYSVPADVSGTITPTVPPGDSSVNVSISTPGQNGTLTFAGTSAHRYSLKASSGPSGSVSLVRPDGSTQASLTSGALAAFMEPQTLATTDTYSLKVDPTNAATGSLALTLYDVPADTTGTVSIGGSAVAVPLAIPGQNGSLTFSGTSGQQVTVHLTGNTFGWTTVNLLKPDGSTLTSSWWFTGSFDLSQQTLPTTGTYTIVVDPTGANAGTINVSVSNP
jgi:YD repeat-containing protein